jgi:septal ring factor EnvC (AmiA/AmiB activator)
MNHFKVIESREELLMARQANYDQKIESLKAKIETKTLQLKKLKEQLAEVEKAAAQSKNEEVMSFLADNNLNPNDVLNVLRERFGQN